MSSIVAVYGSLRAGLHNHPVLGDSAYISMGTLNGFGMYSLGQYPALTKKGEKSEVVVELYDVLDMKPVDALEGYPSYYKRKRVKVDTPKGAVMAWVYYMDRDFTSSFIECGDWKKYLREMS